MSTTLADWIAELPRNLESAVYPLDIRGFEGTERECMTILDSARQESFELVALDVGDVTSAAADLGEARGLFEQTLKNLAARTTPALVVITRVNLMFLLNPRAPTQSLSRFLRTGRNAVLLVLPPIPDAVGRDMPEGAVMNDWRRTILQTATPLSHPSSHQSDSS